MIQLTGLKSGVPIGFLAALGALRQAERLDLGRVKMSWVPRGGQWCAALHFDREVTVNEFSLHLMTRIQSLGTRAEFTWADGIKTATRDLYVRESGSALHGSQRDLVDWFAAFGSELVTKTDGETIEPTPLDMTVARQQFLADAQWLTESLGATEGKGVAASNLEAMREALFGPWRYADNQHSLGWDPPTVLMGAFTPKAPTAMSKSGVRGAVWLAMEALPFFPCFYDQGAATRGFRRAGRTASMLWPVWTIPLTGEAVATVLAQTPSMAKSGEWRRRGLAALYASKVYKPNKYLTCFQAAAIVGEQ